MAKKTTVADLEALVALLAARLDGAHTWCVKAQAKIEALEAQDTKTRKQLWYLQKVAKGEFAIGSSKPTVPGDEVRRADCDIETKHDAMQLSLAENQPF